METLGRSCVTMHWAVDSIEDECSISTTTATQQVVRLGPENKTTGGGRRLRHELTFVDLTNRDSRYKPQADRLVANRFA